MAQVLNSIKSDPAIKSKKTFFTEIHLPCSDYRAAGGGKFVRSRREMRREWKNTLKGSFPDKLLSRFKMDSGNAKRSGAGAHMDGGFAAP